jgi:tetratricopeptide (TPR) repeat protein
MATLLAVATVRSKNNLAGPGNSGASWAFTSLDPEKRKIRLFPAEPESGPPPPRAFRRYVPASLPGLLVAAFAFGCGAGLPGPAIPSPAEVPALEARVERDPSDLAAALALAAAYRETGRAEAARSLLERTRFDHPAEPGVVLLLGLTYEDLGLYPEAAEQYHRYVELSRSAPLRARIQARAREVQRQAWVVGARAALAQEAGLAAAAPEPRTVAVFPFLFQAWDEELRPLGRAVAELVVTDLAQVPRIRVLERTRVQVLLDEARLTGEGLVDPATAVRSGRLLGAERIVQGRIAGVEDAMELQAAVVAVADGPDRPVTPISEQDAARRLFDMQKRLVLALFPSLGIELTPAEQARIARRPTEDLQALLQFGMGLEAEDRGAYREAAGHFGQAAALDAGFDMARLRADAAARTADEAVRPTAELTPQALGSYGAAEADLAAVDELVPEGGRRDAASEALGQEGIGAQGGVIRILIRTRAGGGS